VLATRLLVVANSKMLPALASGLREGARFDVVTASLEEPSAIQAAATDAEAVALFYGGPAIVQTLASLRERGGRVVAVLQLEQLPQRNDCFRAGASDLLFMPMPKDQFVSRLVQACELSFTAADGSPAEVAVATRSTALKLSAAGITAAGIEAATEAGSGNPLKPGETVRLSFGPFQVWGLVARGAEPLQIRFAGLTPAEEGQIRKWLQQRAAAQTAGEPAAAVEVRPTWTGESARVAPAMGPPPGFADRRPVRASTRPEGARGTTPPALPPVTPPAVDPLAAAPPAIDPSPASAAAAQPVEAAPPNGAPPPDLFDEGPVAAAEGSPAKVPPGPAWPTLYPPSSGKNAALLLLQDKTAAPNAPPAVTASARKVTGALNSAEREALLKAGPGSPFADAVAARIALDAATAEGVKLHAAIPAPTVDAAAAASLTRQADEAAARLQKEANSAVVKGEVENLQLVAAASAALSRDLLSFKETADKLKGLAAAPRLGGGALDPHVAVPGELARPTSGKPAEKQPLRAELRDFRSLDAPKSGTWSRRFLLMGLVLLVVLVANAFYFGMPRADVLKLGAGGPYVQEIQVIKQNALVTVTPDWVLHADTEAAKLVAVLRERGVDRATVLLPNGRLAANLDVRTGKLIGLIKPAVAKPR
jgi:hypothetical protein